MEGGTMKVISRTTHKTVEESLKNINSRLETLEVPIWYECESMKDESLQGQGKHMEEFKLYRCAQWVLGQLRDEVMVGNSRETTLFLAGLSNMIEVIEGLRTMPGTPAEYADEVGQRFKVVRKSTPKRGRKQKSAEAE